MIYILLLIAGIYIFVMILYRQHKRKIGFIHSVIGYIILDGVDSSTVKTLKLFTDRLAVINNFSEIKSIPINRVEKVSELGLSSINIEFLDNDNNPKTLRFRIYKNKNTEFNNCVVMVRNINEQLKNIEQQTNKTDERTEKLQWNTEINSQSKEDKIFNNTNEQFQNIRLEVLSKKVWCTYELGILNPLNKRYGLEQPSYFIYVDGFMYQITSYLHVNFYKIRDIYISGGLEDTILIKEINKDTLYILEKGMKSNIEEYFKTLSSKYEPIFKMEVDVKADKLLSNPEAKLLLTNFLSIYGESFFEDIPNVNYLEDIVLSSLFYRESYKKYSYYSYSSQYQQFIELLGKKNLLEIHDVFIKHQVFETRNINMYYDYFLTRCLKSLAIDYFSSSFEKNYGQYFKNISNLSINDCIKNYFDIETLEHSRKDSVSRLVYYLYKNNSNVRNLSSNSIYDIYCVINEKISDFKKNKQLNNFEKELMKHNSIQEVSENELDKVTIHDVDLFSGIEFENFIAYLFKKMGYKVTLTKASGDQGIDVIAEKNGLRLGVQAKCYSSKVSNTAVQEVSAGINHYNLSKGLVVTNNYFTQSAKELAKTNDVLLWDREILKEKIKDALNESSIK